MNRQPASGARTAGEGAVIATAAVVAADVAGKHFADVEGAGALAAAVVGGAGAWVASVARNLGSEASTPGWVKVLLGVRR